MKNIKISYVIIIFALTLLWLIADPILWSSPQLFPLRKSLINYTGIMAISVMSIAMMLAIRPTAIEPFLGGLDKTYRLHKWLGITALIFSVLHYLWKMVPKWLVNWGLLVKPAHHDSNEDTFIILRFFKSLHGLAESVGEWAFYATIIFIVLALVKWFPYRYFFKTHRFIAVVYLFLVFHSIILLKSDYWNDAIAPVLMVLLIGGTIGAFLSLSRKVGISKRVVGSIKDMYYHTNNRVLQVSIDLQNSWNGHQAGQFAFITFDQKEGPHPFTISSAWNNDGKVDFLIKGLGDYTKKLPSLLNKGDEVEIEGPYGKFDFSEGSTKQIWVAGGIGITPFIARLEALATKNIDQQTNQTIDLFYSTNEPDTSFIDTIKKSAQQANVTLHVIVATKDGRLTSDKICEKIPDWQGSTIWFCGPKAFGDTLRSDFIAKGLKNVDFHQELFEMR
ncbi:ferric reductase-like transmembrane domain-containing protein [Thalassotalea piscium]